MAELSRFYSVEDLMQILDVSRSTVDRLTKQGKIPGRVKIGGCVKFLRAAVDNWIAEAVTA